MSKDFRETFERRIKKWPSGNKSRIQMSKDEWKNFKNRIQERQIERNSIAEVELEEEL